eukprot:3135526-Amphidinium_carterae.2
MLTTPVASYSPHQGYPSYAPHGVPSYVPQGVPSYVPQGALFVVPHGAPSYVPQAAPTIAPQGYPSYLPPAPIQGYQSYGTRGTRGLSDVPSSEVLKRSTRQSFLSCDSTSLKGHCSCRLVGAKPCKC